MTAPLRELSEDHGMRDFLIVCAAILVAEAAGRVVLAFAGSDMGMVMAVMAFVLGIGAGAACLVLTCPERAGSRTTHR